MQAGSAVSLEQRRARRRTATPIVFQNITIAAVIAAGVSDRGICIYNCEHAALHTANYSKYRFTRQRKYHATAQSSNHRAIWRAERFARRGRSVAAGPLKMHTYTLAGRGTSKPFFAAKNSDEQTSTNLDF
ncbi:hypothetical protein WA026_009522, partial [Henosepilachna vigintioctopunctata]